MSEQIAKELGEIKGLLQGIDKKVDGLEVRQEKQDERLRAVERKAMVNSTVVASVVSVGVAFIKQKVGA
ncbi:MULTISPECIES: hypothetical protein [unclassified Pseudovibrio]|uniref:hypothetical protein n=1 Tax=unclassified Pseudovibrio TaxID=2627060 RepID=UPI0007AE4F0F|nr:MULTISPECIES: hypothetical protein [unclassified Pseudovibrio]KZL05534.1 hypothetical protein PsAD26_04331 [Pseudovibrio sp. Ad26]KZL29427.1 hypothetical protein PsWM33_00002 [Pseudovibrio sp. WM33]